MLAGRHHGDDDLCFPYSVFGILSHDNALGGRSFEIGRDEVEAIDRKILFDEIGGHGPTHVAEADESDLHGFNSQL